MVFVVGDVRSDDILELAEFVLLALAQRLFVVLLTQNVLKTLQLRRLQVWNSTVLQVHRSSAELNGAGQLLKLFLLFYRQELLLVLGLERCVCIFLFLR